MLGLVPWLAAVPPDRRALTQGAFSLWATLAILALVGLALLVVLMGLRRSARRAGARRRRSTVTPDPWFEAGRRAPIPPPRAPDEPAPEEEAGDPE